MLFGLAPALQTVRSDFTYALNERGQARIPRQRRLTRGLFIVGELTLTLTLIVGAGLLIRSLALLVRTDPGFDAHRVLTLDVLLPEWKYEPPQSSDFFARLLERLAGMPGVESAAAAMSRPILSVNSWGTNFTIGGRDTTGQELKAAMNPITPGYFRTLRIPLEKGRDFSLADHLTAPAVVIISESMARRYFPEEDPLGKVITHEIDFGPQVARSRTIIGFDFGPAHTEVRLTEEAPVVVEINPRLAGGMIPELVRHALGIDLLSALLNQLCGQPVELAARRAEWASIRFLTADRCGRLAGWTGAEEAGRVPSVREITLLKRLGATVRKAEEAADRIGFVIAGSASRADLLFDLERAMDSIRLNIDQE